MSKIPVVASSGSKRRLDCAFDDVGNTDISNNDVSTVEHKRMNITASADQSECENGKRYLTKFGSNFLPNSILFNAFSTFKSPFFFNLQIRTCTKAK